METGVIIIEQTFVFGRPPISISGDGTDPKGRIFAFSEYKPKEKNLASNL